MEVAFLEAFCCFLEFLNVAGLTADVYSWIKAAPNRTARRTAAARGDDVPRRDGWSWLVIGLTIFCGIVGIAAAIRWWHWFMR